MKTIQKIRFILFAVIAAGLVGVQSVNAQKINEERMNRDIKVAEKILGELFRSSRGSENNSNIIYYSVQNTSSIRGTYVPNYGVLFRVPQLFFTNISDGVVYVNSEGQKSVMSGRVKVLNIDKYKSGDVVYWLDKQARRLDPVIINGRSRKRREVKGISIDSVLNGRKKKALGLIKTFLSDYSSLLSQLSDNDKIVVTYDRVLNMNRVFRTHPEKSKDNSFMVSVKYGDVKNSRGKNLDKKMTVSSLEMDQKERIHFNVFKRILDEVFERRNTDGKSFYRSGRSTYTYLKGFGVMYDIRLRKPRKGRRSSYGYVINGTGGSNTIVIDDGGKVNRRDSKLSEKERREKREKEKVEYRKVLKDAYAKLEKDMKKHMVDYGRTLRSLKPNEMLMFNVRLSSSYRYYDLYNENGKKEERLPSLMVMSIKMSDLDSSNAESKISVKKY